MVEVVAVAYLGRTAVPGPDVRDDVITFGEEEQHLRGPNRPLKAASHD